MSPKRLAAAGLALIVALVLSSGVALAAKPAPTGKVNLNTATADQLTTLPGIGAKLAARIVEYRQKAPFKSTQELMNVRGVGEKNFAKIEAYLTVGDAAPKTGAGR